MQMWSFKSVSIRKILPLVLQMRSFAVAFSSQNPATYIRGKRIRQPCQQRIPIGEHIDVLRKFVPLTRHTGCNDLVQWAKLQVFWTSDGS